MLKWLKSPSHRTLKISSLLILAAVGVVMGYGVKEIGNINTHYSMSQFMPKEHPLYKSDRLIKKTFRLTDQEPIIVNLQLPASAKGTWLEQDRIDLITRATEAMHGIEGVEKITSIANVESAADVNGSIQVDRLLSLVPEKDWKKRVLKDPLLTPGLMSKDGRVVTIIGDIGFLTEAQVKLITEQIRERVSKQVESIGATINVSGVIPLQTQMTSLLSAELINFFGLAFLVCLITLVLYFRSYSTVFMCLILVVIANISTMACLALLGIPFSVLSSVLPIICSIEALAIGSHTLLLFSDKYRQAMAQPNPDSKAMVVWKTFKGLTGPNFLMSTTTIIGFASLIISTVPLIRQFALSVACGILVSCVFMSIAMAPLMYLFPIPVARQWTGAKARWALWVIANRKMVVGSFLAIVAFLLINGFSLNWSVQLYDDLPNSGDIKSSADLIDAKLGGMIPFQVMVTKAGEQDPWNDPARMKKLASVLSRWRENGAIGSAIGLPDFLNTGIQNMNSRQSIAETLFLYGFSGEKNPTAQFLSGDGSSTRLMFRLKDVPADLMTTTLAAITRDVRKTFPGATVQTGGMASMVHPLNAELSGDLIYGLWHSLLLISIILVIVFRSFRLAFIAAVPNLLPPFALLATMTYLNTPIKPVVAIIFSIALGLAYNNTVFLLTRLKKLQQNFTGAGDVIMRTWYQEGNPCFFSSIAVLGGFAVFLASYFSPNRTFGAYMLWSIGIGLIGDLVLLPALLRMFPWFIFPGEEHLNKLKNLRPALVASTSGKVIRTLLLVIALLSAATPRAAAADNNVVRTPFLMTMHGAAFSAVINEGAIQKNLSGEKKSPAKDIFLTEPFNVAVTGINVGLKYSFSAPLDPKKPTEWLVQHKKLSATLEAASIVAHQVIKRIVNGNEIEIRLDGECRNVKLELPEGSAEASGRLTLGSRNGAPRLLMQNFKAEWKPGSWKVVSMQCTGPQGFDTLVAKAALERLQTIDPYFNELSESMQAGLDETLNGPIRLELGNPIQKGQTLRLNAPPARSGANGDVVVKGEAFFYFKAGKSGCGADIREFAAEPTPKAKDVALYVPFTALKALVACTHSDGTLSFEADSSKFDAFNKLMHSWMSKKAVFPDLNNFDENSVFRFSGVSSAPPELVGEKPAQNANAFTMRLNQKMNILMRAPKDGSYQPYVHLSAYFSGPVYVSVVGGKISMKPMEGGRLALGGQWNADYVRKYEPEQEIDFARISEEAQKGLADMGWNIAIPSFGVSQNLRLVPKDGNLHGPNYRIGFDLK